MWLQPIPRGESHALAAKVFRRLFKLVQKSKAGFGVYVWLSSFLLSDAIDGLFLETRDVSFYPKSPAELKKSLADLGSFRNEMKTFFSFR